jgi:hypothetical protein
MAQKYLFYRNIVCKNVFCDVGQRKVAIFFLASYLTVDNVGNGGVLDGRTRGLQLAKDANSSGQVSTGLPLLLNDQQQL